MLHFLKKLVSVIVILLALSLSLLGLTIFTNKALAADCGIPKKEGLRIFVSFSMPENLLISLDQQARKIGAKLAIRGLKNNSFKETFSYIKSMSAKGLVIDIDPKSFEEFEITQVPAFVINQGDKFDKLVGNVSITYVLKEFSEKGDLKDNALEYLGRLENENK